MFEITDVDIIESEQKFAIELGFVISPTKIALYNTRGIIFYNPETNEYLSDDSFNQPDAYAKLIRTPTNIPTIWMVKDEKVISTRVYNSDLSKIIVELHYHQLIPSHVYKPPQWSYYYVVVVIGGYLKKYTIHNAYNEEGGCISVQRCYSKHTNLLPLTEDRLVVGYEQHAYRYKSMYYQTTHLYTFILSGYCLIKKVVELKESRTEEMAKTQFCTKIIDILKINENSFAVLEMLKFKKLNVANKFFIKIWENKSVKFSVLVPGSARHLYLGTDNTLFAYFIENAEPALQVLAIDLISEDSNLLKITAPSFDPRCLVSSKEGQIIVSDGGRIARIDYINKRPLLSAANTQQLVTIKKKSPTDKLYQLMILSNKSKINSSPPMVKLPNKLWFKVFEMLSNWNDLIALFSTCKSLRRILFDLDAVQVQKILPFQYELNSNRIDNLKIFPARRNYFGTCGGVACFKHRSLCISKFTHHRVIKCADSILLQADGFIPAASLIHLNKYSYVVLVEKFLLGYSPENIQIFELGKGNKVFELDLSDIHIVNCFALAKNRVLVYLLMNGQFHLKIYEVDGAFSCVENIVTSNYPIKYISAAKNGLHFCYLVDNQLSIYESSKLNLIGKYEWLTKIKSLHLLDSRRLLISCEGEIQLIYMGMNLRKFILPKDESQFCDYDIINSRDVIAILTISKLYVVSGRDLNVFFEFPSEKYSTVSFYENDTCLYLSGVHGFTKRIGFDYDNKEEFEPRLAKPGIRMSSL